MSQHNKDNIVIFDTTLRDGEQSPGASMNPREKVEIARHLEQLGVDVIEAIRHNPLPSGGQLVPAAGAGHLWLHPSLNR